LLRPEGQRKTVRTIRPALILGLTSLSISGLAFAQLQPQGQTQDTGGPTGIQVSPSVGVNQLYTDNQTGTGGSQPVFVTQITPGISVTGETARTKINLNYLPTFNHFDNGGSKDRIDQNLNTNAEIDPIPDALSVKFQGYANTADASGNASNQQGILVPTNNRILYYIGNVAPRYQQNFRDIATLEVNYSVNSTNTSVDGVKLPGLGINSTNSLGQNALVSIGSAESFGRLGLRADFSHNTNSGSGMNTESTSGVDTITVSYHLNRNLYVSGSLGYQSINYPATGADNPGYRSDGVTWTLGVTITPNALSTIAIGYGKQQGSYSPSIQVGYALGPRTNISASYLVTVQNQLTATLQNLKYLTYDQFGNPIDSRTGLPFSAVNQTFGSQNILFRDKPALVSISHQFTRSAVTLTGQYEVRNSLSGVQTNTEVLSGTINYSRQFSPLAQGNVSLGYTQAQTKTFGAADNRARSFSLSGQLLYNLSDTTSINVVENLFRTINNDSQNNSLTQQLSIGLRKSF
jgi:uncharacterized protein (PEP-CTERM system associated)